MHNKYKSEDMVGIYFEQVSKYPLLTREEEIALVKRIKEGDLKARKTLINANLRFVFLIAKNYVGRSPNLELLDLIQEGNLGLIRAVKKFDLRHGCKLFTYADYWIRDFIKIALYNQSRMIRIPVYMEKNIKKYLSMKEKFLSKFGREPSLEEIALNMGLPIKEIRNIAEAESDVYSLEDLIKEDLEELSYDIAEEKKAPCNHANKNPLIRKTIRKALIKLNSREQIILSMMYGLKDNVEYSPKEIGKTIGSSSDSVSQTLQKALEKLRQDKTIHGLT